jgi:hypothetical protein
MCTSIWQGGLTNREKTHGVEPFNTANYSRFKRLADWPNPNCLTLVLRLRASLTGTALIDATGSEY